MFLDTIDFSEGAARRGKAHLEFSFPLPPSVAAQVRPPRAILSLRSAGSMRYLADEPNERRSSFFDDLGIEAGRVVGTELHHTRRLKIVREVDFAAADGGEETDLGSLGGEAVGDGGPDDAEGFDGMLFLSSDNGSGRPRRPVATVTVADCMPIWLWDGASGAWGILHSGWKGTGILAHALSALKSRGLADTASLSIILGPAIGSCCYEVSDARAESYAREFGEECVDRSGSLPRLDLRAANLAIARNFGAGAVLSVDVCTSCEGTLGSYRREGSLDFTRMVAACLPA